MARYFHEWCTAGGKLSIVCGESGPGARSIKKEWVISIRNQCRRAGAASYFKQWGGARKHANGRMLDGRIYDAIPAAAGQPLVPAFFQPQPDGS